MKIQVRWLDNATDSLIEEQVTTLAEYRADNPNAPTAYAMRDDIKNLGLYIHTTFGGIRVEIRRAPR